MNTPFNMPFALKPTETRSQVRKAGNIISGRDFGDLDWAVDLASRWRACHAYPINTFQSTLRTKLKAHEYSDYTVAQRLKRLPTIIDKLQRYPSMQLITMQDIGGVRAILPKVKDVYRLRDEYMNSSHFAEMQPQERDYIAHPKEDDGYRSLHIVFTYKNDRNPIYDDLKLEMQIRTKLQHTWSTAVETMGTFTGQALKSRQGDAAWLDFFTVTSSAFAYVEKQPPIPKYQELNEKETFALVKRKEAELNVLNMMAGFSIATDAIHRQKGRGSSYWLITLDSVNKSVDIEPFANDSLEPALEAYAKMENEALKGRRIEPVLVSSGSIETLRKAYPNFFLDTSEFEKQLRTVIGKVK